MDYLKGFYKKVGIAPVAEVKEQTKKQRQLARHQVRQSFRNLNDSDEENVATQQPPRIKVNAAPKMGPPPQVEMERLLKFREQKRKLKQTQEQQPLLPAKRKPFVATISRQDISLTYKRIFEPYKKCTKKEATTTLAVSTNRAPLRPVAPFLNGRDHQAPPERIPLPKSASKKTIQSDAKQQHPLGEWKGRTPLLAFRNVPPRVDCWWPKSGPPLITLDGGCLQRPAASVSAKKPNPSVSAKKPATVRALESKSSRKPSAKQGNATNSSKKPPQGQPQRKQPAVMVFHGTKAGSKAANGTSNAKAVLTSTVRKTKNAFTFTLAPNENAGRPQFQSLAYGKMDELFDGISPIETHSPAPPTAAYSPKQQPRTKVPDAKHRKEESFWEPQPVAFLSLAAETTGVAVDNVERPVTTSLDESSSSVVCLGEIETVGQSKNRSPTDEQSTMMLAGGGGTPKRAVSLNESFTVSEDVGGTDDEVFCAKTSAKEPAFGCRPTIEAIDETVATEEPQPAQTQKRCSLVFTEQINVPPAEPSMPGEHSSDAMPSPLCSRRLSSTKRRSSVYTVSEQGTQMPEEVRSKTDFYKDKVQCELARLQMLCDEYGPYLESDTLNEHCRGLLMAAQGQTNILINKKLTKFQELIGHYESNWTDRKVRKDDLDGFWQMVALDLENLDQRFEELRSLRANDWQPIVQEKATADDLPAKTKKLQAGAGIRKRERKGAAAKSSSVVAELIRQARLEQKKKKLTDLGELAETVTLVTTPLKRSQRLAETPKRNSVARRSSICMMCTPTAADGRKHDRSANKCGSIFPEADNEDEDNLKPSLRSSASNGSRSSKSVLFMDACLETPQSRRRQSTRKIVDTPKPAKDPQDEHDPESSSPAAPKQTSQQRNRRKSIVSFTEQIDDPPTVPSKSNLRLEEADLLGLLNNSSLAKSLRKATKTKELQMLEEVRSKTDFYKDKVQCELARLQMLCDEYGPYLESDTLNEHCRGLLMAAQGQTNILINKKLTKFQELIGHYESNWTDRKVRKDDLDGFWQMVALDLENLDQRFEELRTLRANDWQPIVQEEATGDDQPAKTKKLQAGAGIRKREKKGAAAKSSSVVAELIRQARLEQKKKKLTDLGELAETVTLVTTPLKRSQRLAETPKRNSVARRSSICMVCTPTAADARKHDRSANKCGSIFPEADNEDEDNLKPSLKGRASNGSRSAKSVLFMDACLETPQSRRRQSTRKIVDTPKLVKDPHDEHDPESSSPAAPKQTSQQRNRRKSIVSFTEQIDDPPTVPSKSNLRLEEADLLGLLNNSSLAKSLRKAAKTKELQMPEEVRSKTDFYKDKVQCELARLQMLCDEYGPYLVSDTLNEHCRGLLMAAQGQTNILINKKLTKFQELIDHYESNWTDRKVRKDDLDGFWQMVALDLENLDQRFEELRTLRANDWQPIVQEEATGDDQPAKTKKLQSGAGIRKRERKGAANGAAGKSSSVVAELIRKARLEQKKKKVTDLGELAETVTLVTSPVKRSQRVAESGSELKQRASVCFGFAPAIASPATKDTRRTMFPGLNRRSRDNLKSILKTPNVDRANESKSVLFLDNALQTPQAGDTTASRTRQFPVTPKLRLKFNDQLELEHIDRLDSRTPSRLEGELRKRLRQSLLSNSASTGESAEVEKPESTSTDRCTGTPRTNAASKRKSRRISRTLAAIFDDANDGVVEESPVPMMGRMRTRASANTPRRNAS